MKIKSNQFNPKYLKSLPDPSTGSILLTLGELESIAGTGVRQPGGGGGNPCYLPFWNCKK